MGETEKTKKYCEKLNSIGPHIKFIVKEAKWNRGHADLFGTINGHTYILEMKTEEYWKNRPGHALQLKELREWKAAGAKTLLLKTDEDRASFLKIAKLTRKSPYIPKDKQALSPDHSSHKPSHQP